VDYAQALEVALCYGWIDGAKDKFDEEYWLQRFTPRGPRSKWSKINRDKAEALVAGGAMRPAGRAQIDAARADGRWDAAYAGAKSATVPEDLAANLGAHSSATRRTPEGGNRAVATVYGAYRRCARGNR